MAISASSLPLNTFTLPVLTHQRGPQHHCGLCMLPSFQQLRRLHVSASASIQPSDQPVAGRASPGLTLTTAREQKWSERSGNRSVLLPADQDPPVANYIQGQDPNSSHSKVPLLHTESFPIACLALQSLLNSFLSLLTPNRALSAAARVHTNPSLLYPACSPSAADLPAWGACVNLGTLLFQGFRQ